jgi:tRNA A37 threonylcarbamoyladenosine modification protein TsaB
MRWVFIDTSSAGTCRFGTIGTDGIAIRSVDGRSGRLLPLLERAFKGKDPSSSDGIAVVAGPGSFSSVRGGVVVANVLARCWSVPLFGVSVDEAKDLVSLADRLAHGDVAATAFVTPRYTSEPNITVKKKST